MLPRCRLRAKLCCSTDRPRSNRLEGLHLQPWSATP
jgi:hypothetical protein